MTPEERLAKAFSNWMWELIKPSIARIVRAAVAKAVAGEREQVITEAAIFWVGVATRFRLDGDEQMARELDKAISVMQDAIRSQGEGEG